MIPAASQSAAKAACASSVGDQRVGNATRRSSPISARRADAVHPGLTGVAHLLVALVEREAQGRRVATFGLAALAHVAHAVDDLIGLEEDVVELVRVADGIPGRDPRPVAADDDRDARLLDAARLVDRRADMRVATLVRGASRGEHLGDDRKVVTEDGEPLGQRREAVAVRPPLVFLPAGADAQLEATAADDVDGRRLLGRQRRIAESRAHDHVAESDAFGADCQRGEDGERLERHLVFRLGHRVEVIEHPQRLEAERFGLLGELDRAGPPVRRPPAVVFALPALRSHETDLHPCLQYAPCR